MNVILPDGSELALPEGATGRTVAEAIGPRLAKAALGVTINGTLSDLDTPLSQGDQVGIVTAQSKEGLDLLRHSASHVMAEAVTRVYPGTKVAIGPSIKDGFYYDFDFPEPISEEDITPVSYTHLQTCRPAWSDRLPTVYRFVSAGLPL